ncbi:tetratricopeptide repeat-containing protein [Allostreptomyces psammosilenae]|uniref:Kinesin light chain n=1 Tax=Allostreptomyces psammosilenae TaxID=1892865 RepID=A0A853A497_9ACTN|nr:tetratricopeptide repeat-containing protein [Allostreptomyces psammosilenae]NYI05322.1 hypothetical protein [Allostreptomyces psammosilenae]
MDGFSDDGLGDAGAEDGCEVTTDAAADPGRERSSDGAGGRLRGGWERLRMDARASGTGQAILAGNDVHIYGPAASGNSAGRSPITPLPLLPPPQVDPFQHREIADRLYDVMAPTSDLRAREVVLAGLGGVGKTQLAVQYVNRVLDGGESDLVVWITAESREAVLSGYAEAAAAVGLHHADPQAAANRFLSWLATTERRWLLVLDHLTDPAAITESGRDLRPQRRDNGRVLITTLHSDAVLRNARDRLLIKVGPFSHAEAVNYLNDRLGGSQRAADVAQLANDLDHLPLALAQASAYMLEYNLDCAAYRERFEAQRLEQVLLRGTMSESHRSTVAATWSLSIEQADRIRPYGLARPLLELASVLDPNGIPASVFITEPARTYLARYRTGVEGGEEGRAVSPADARDARFCLRRLSLADFADEEHRSPSPPVTVRIPSLVQRATRESLSDERLEGVYLAAADALYSAWPEFERERSLGQALRANVEALRQLAGDVLWRSGVHPVLFRAGGSLGNTGLVATAVEYYEELLRHVRKALGADAPDTLTVRSDLAHWQGKKGDATGAVAALEAVRVKQERILGLDHPNTLTTRASLAYWRRRAGDRNGADTDYIELLPAQRRVLGAEHRDTLSTQAYLALRRGETGDPAGATAALEEVRAVQERVLGADHPNTLTTRASLAEWRGRAGDPEGAVSDYDTLLADQQRVLGEHYPNTLATRSSLAVWRGKAGDPQSAVTDLAELLHDQRRLLGSDHPNTLMTRQSLAEWRGRAGNPAAAVSALEALLDDRRRILGREHPHTLATARVLAEWRAVASEGNGGGD